jgi:RsiW-degrading membrane proteinase PrsW (M82 family)
MLIAALVAFPAVAVYLLVPVIIDRYDPEPWWALLGAFAWGGIVGCGFAGWINSIIGSIGQAFGPEFGTIMGAVVSAPIVEEFWKGLFIALLFFFLRREFDGVVDGLIYATFAALGFAAVENILYYARAGMQDNFVSVVILRGILSPWCHPLFTSMTGLGFGIARETNKTWLKFLAPLLGYCTAVVLHASWNGIPTFAGLITGSNGVAGVTMILMIILFFFFMVLFLALLIALVVREGRIIRRFLLDEVALGNLSQEELELVCSPVGRIRALFTRGGLRGRRFVTAAAKLAMKKWHTMRAMEGKKQTISIDFILPLRQELAQIRAEIGVPAPNQRPVPTQPDAPQYAGPVGYGPQGSGYGPQGGGYGPQGGGYGPQGGGYGPQGGGYPPGGQRR